MRVIDLSHPIHEGMTTFPSHWHPAVEVTQLGRHGIENRESRKLVLGTHTGTHVDAPSHFIEGGATLDSLPVSLLAGPAVVVDLGPAKPRRQYTLADLQRAVGRGKPGKRVILRFGWSRRWGSAAYYTEAPYLSLEAYRWLAGQGVRLLGTDTPNVDFHEHGWKSGNDCPNHRLLLGRGIFLVEYLANLHLIRKRAIEWIVAPLNVRGSDGAPARCLAVER